MTTLDPVVARECSILSLPHLIFSVSRLSRERQTVGGTITARIFRIDVYARGSRRRSNLQLEGAFSGYDSLPAGNSNGCPRFGAAANQVDTATQIFGCQI